MKNSTKQESLNNKPRVMLIVPMLHQGGFERICALTAKLLNENCKVTLVVFTLEDQFYDVSGIDVVNLNLGVANGKIGKAIQLLKRIKAVRKIKKERDIQIAYSFGTSANLVNVFSKTKKSVAWSGMRGYCAMDENLQLISKKADRVVSCTKDMENDINKVAGPKKSATLYNPCNVNEIEELAKNPIDANLQEFVDKPGKLVVTLGREDDLKGYWHLLKSFKILQQSDSTAKLMIIGDGDFSAYEKLAKDLGLSNICFAGVHKNPFAILRRCDLYVLTSVTEGFPNALIEAMAVGLPVLSVNCKTGPAEILCKDYLNYNFENHNADYGVLVPNFTGDKNMDATNISKEEEAFAKYMYECLQDEKLLEHYSEAGQKRAREFSMESYVENIHKLIQADI